MKKLQALALAVHLLAGGASHALTPSQVDSHRVFGSLKHINVVAPRPLGIVFASALQDVCDPATFDVFTLDGAFQRVAYSCLLAVDVGWGSGYPAGTPLLVTMQNLDHFSDAVVAAGLRQQPPAQRDALVVTASATPCTKIDEGQSPALRVDVAGYLCPAWRPMTVDVGIFDVEPSLLLQSINRPDHLLDVGTGTLTGGPLVQRIYGVAVNNKLYFALQRAQFPAATAGKTLADIDALPQPSLPTQFVRSALTGQITGSVNGNKGWNVVVPNDVDPRVSGKTVNVCRSTEGGGLQAASNIYFANNPCGGASQGLPPSGVTGSTGGTTGTLSVRTGLTAISESTGSAVVEGCLATVELATVGPGDDQAYALGILARENDPNAPWKSFRFVKLDGVAPTLGEAKVGNYPFVFEATMNWDAALVAADQQRHAFLNGLRVVAGKSSTLALHSRLEEGFMAAPSSYAGAYLTMQAVGGSADRKFASRVSRYPSNSCSPIRIVK
jgi:hypothetical protein